MGNTKSTPKQEEIVTQIGATNSFSQTQTNNISYHLSNLSVTTTILAIIALLVSMWFVGRLMSKCLNARIERRANAIVLAQQRNSRSAA